MAVKASATITLSFMVDVKGVYRYYKLQASTASAPTKPTTNPPSGWTTTEPSYTSGSTNTLYFVDLTVLTNGTWSYSDVSKSSSYEAAKEAWNKAQNAQDTANNAQNQLDKKGLRETIIDLLDTDTYDTDTYYPVVGTSIPATGYHTFEVNNQLRSNTAPSWSTHNAKGFTCNLSARMIANGWGVVSNNYGWIDNASYAWCDKMPAYIQQMEHSSLPVFYLRGGGKYYVYTDYACTWSIKTDIYTNNSNYVEPTTTPSNYSKLVNNWEVVTRVTNAETSITKNEEAIKLRATKTEVSESISNIQVGGRNLLIGTSNSVTHTGTGSTNQCTQLYEKSDYYNSISVLEGKQFTLSFDWETTATSGKFIVLTNDTPWADMSEYITPSSTNQSGKSVFTFTCTSKWDAGAYTGIRVRSDNLTGTVTIKNAMLEIGNKPSSWQPAPEDIQFGGRNYILNSVLKQPMIVYDSGASGWACPQGVVNASIDKTFTHNGHNTLHKQCTYVDDNTWFESNYYFAGTNCVQFNPNEIWTLSLWIYAETIPTEPLLSSVRLFNKNWTWANKVCEIPIGDIAVTEVDVWKHVEITFNVPSTIPTYDRGYVMFTTNQTADCYMTEFKLEKGMATDWTPAPEDIDEDIADVKTYADAQIKVSADNIESTVSTTYVTKDDANSTYAKSTDLKQTSDAFQMNFKSLQKTVSDNQASTEEQLSEWNDYIRFEGGNIILGKSGNSITCKITNDRLSFLQNGVEIAYLSNNQLNINKANVTNRLQIGNFVFQAKSDGGLTIAKST